MSNLAQQLIARLWEKMSEGRTFEECRANEQAANAAGPEVWDQVDKHFAERAAHPEDGSDA